jgi:hypothetical protein
MFARVEPLLRTLPIGQNASVVVRMHRVGGSHPALALTAGLGR